MKIRITDRDGNPAPAWMGALLADADAPVRPDDTSFWADRRRDYRVEVTA